MHWRQLGRISIIGRPSSLPRGDSPQKARRPLFISEARIYTPAGAIACNLTTRTPSESDRWRDISARQISTERHLVIHRASRSHQIDRDVASVASKATPMKRFQRVRAVPASVPTPSRGNAYAMRRGLYALNARPLKWKRERFYATPIDAVRNTRSCRRAKFCFYYFCCFFFYFPRRFRDSNVWDECSSNGGAPGKQNHAEASSFCAFFPPPACKLRELCFWARNANESSFRVFSEEGKITFANFAEMLSGREWIQWEQSRTRASRDSKCTYLETRAQCYNEL